MEYMERQPFENDEHYLKMNGIDHKLLETGRKPILIVGMTKAGKSTTYNLISKIPMKAVKEGRSRCYELQKSKSLNNFAEFTGGITSCTLVPNIRKYKDYQSLVLLATRIDVTTWVLWSIILALSHLLKSRRGKIRNSDA
jgi:hypothetical protein